MIKILNPIYDQAFKYLMDNNDIAKKILFLILGKDILQLQMQNVEIPVLNQHGALTSRYDFKAVIREPNGEVRKVLIELQKYKTINPLSRFRDYLGQNYSREDTYIDAHGNEQTEHLPIITVYILGYDIPEIPTRFLKSKHNAVDGVTNQIIETINSDFLKLLTHETYILFVGNKKNYKWQGSEIEVFIRFFQQKTKGVEKNIYIEIDETDNPMLSEIAKHLNLATHDEDMIRRMKAEKDYEDTFKDNLEKDAEIQQLLIKNEEERRQKEEAKHSESEAKHREYEAMRKLAAKMKKYGEPISEIVKETGLSETEINLL